MPSNKRLIQILEHSIERLGEEFQQHENCYFWWESDLQARLFSLLLEEHHFTEEFVHNGRIKSVRLLHREYHAHNGSIFDLALLSTDTAVNFLINCFEDRGDTGLAPHQRLLAAVEICYLTGQQGSLPIGKIDGDVNKLISCKGQVDNAYVLVFMLLQNLKGKPVINYTGVTSHIQSKMNTWRQEMNLKVYCIPSSLEHSPEWFPHRSTHLLCHPE
ncbi:MAG: hypothetical protein DDT32_01257 [Syntrophomonadaceae bacterium]|nr:hypothetical protein [Bacillota bacterium]